MDKTIILRSYFLSARRLTKEKITLHNMPTTELVSSTAENATEKWILSSTTLLTVALPSVEH